MSEWQNKPNFEINKAVVLHRFNPSRIEQYGDKVYMVYEGLDSCNRTFDGCNNPSDAWPIAESFKCAFSSDGAYEPKTGVPWCDDENRLRAAMIVYLEINGVQPE